MLWLREILPDRQDSEGSLKLTLRSERQCFEALKKIVILFEFGTGCFLNLNKEQSDQRYHQNTSLPSAFILHTANTANKKKLEQ